MEDTKKQREKMSKLSVFNKVWDNVKRDDGTVNRNACIYVLSKHRPFNLDTANMIFDNFVKDGALEYVTAGRYKKTDRRSAKSVFIETWRKGESKTHVMELNDLMDNLQKEKEHFPTLASAWEMIHWFVDKQYLMYLNSSQLMAMKKMLDVLTEDYYDNNLE